jgi:hypothetical protein
MKAESLHIKLYEAPEHQNATLKFSNHASLHIVHPAQFRVSYLGPFKELNQTSSGTVCSSPALLLAEFRCLREVVVRFDPFFSPIGFAFRSIHCHGKLFDVAPDCEVADDLVIIVNRVCGLSTFRNCKSICLPLDSIPASRSERFRQSSPFVESSAVRRSLELRFPISFIAILYPDSILTEDSHHISLFNWSDKSKFPERTHRKDENASFPATREPQESEDFAVIEDQNGNTVTLFSAE